jgi:glycine oxidase
MAFPEKSILIVGGGIVGLCLAVAARARDFDVVLIARDEARDTASGVAAGMVAPALEAMGDPDPEAFDRLKAAQAAWLKLMPVWPPSVQAALRRQQAEARNQFIAADGTTSEIPGDWLLDAAATLAALEADFVAHGGALVKGEVTHLWANGAVTSDGCERRAAHIVLAAGYAASVFADLIPGLGVLTPIKGHLFDLPGQGRPGVTRAARAYLADYGASARLGASMEPGRADLDIDPAVVADLKARATALFPWMSLDSATARTGIRAGTPDGWPLIGLDSASGVWLAVGMRRNGYVFAPFAADVILDRLEGRARPDADIYAPRRFS